MPRKPVGTQTRPTADWFTGSTASVGAYASGPAASGVEISLFNNAQAGDYLYVWWISIYNDAENPYFMEAFKGARGTLLQSAVPVVAGNAQPYGQIYWQPVASVPSQPANTGISSDMYGGDEAGTNTCYRSPGPLKVLPPGFGFAVINNMGGGVLFGAILCVTFYFSVLPYIPQ